jgi:hypothetical protein
VYQHKYEWFVKLNGKEYPFMEGMVVGGWFYILPVYMVLFC